MDHQKYSGDASRWHSRIAEEDVELRLLVEKFLRCLLDRCQAGKVDLQEDGLLSRFLLQGSDGGIRVLLTPCRQVDFRVVLQQHLRSTDG